MERDILVEVNHPFIVRMHYGELLDIPASFIENSTLVDIPSDGHLVHLVTPKVIMVKENVTLVLRSISDRRKALPHPGLPPWWRSVHASLQRGRPRRTFILKANVFSIQDSDSVFSPGCVSVLTN